MPFDTPDERLAALLKQCEQVSMLRRCLDECPDKFVDSLVPAISRRLYHMCKTGTQVPCILYQNEKYYVNVRRIVLSAVGAMGLKYVRPMQRVLCAAAERLQLPVVV